MAAKPCSAALPKLASRAEVAGGVAIGSGCGGSKSKSKLFSLSSTQIELPHSKQLLIYHYFLIQFWEQLFPAAACLATQTPLWPRARLPCRAPPPLGLACARGRPEGLEGLLCGGTEVRRRRRAGLAGRDGAGPEGDVACFEYWGLLIGDVG